MSARFGPYFDLNLALDADFPRRVGGPAASPTPRRSTPDRFLLTSAHVFANADLGGEATLAGGRGLDFDVVGADALSDLAVLRSEGRDLHAATLGDAEALRVGQLG